MDMLAAEIYNLTHRVTVNNLFLKLLSLQNTPAPS